MKYATIQGMVGQTFEEVTGEYEGDLLKFISRRGGSDYTFFHEHDCCEYVRIDDICGDLADLVGSPILQAEEASEVAENDECSESGTWTFYKFSTIKGSVTVKWLGESNGYYSESVEYSAFGKYNVGDTVVLLKTSYNEEVKGVITDKYEDRYNIETENEDSKRVFNDENLRYDTVPDTKIGRVLYKNQILKIEDGKIHLK